MLRSISHKLFVIMLTATAIVAVSMYFIMQWNINRGFLRYVNTLDNERLERVSLELARAYKQANGWSAVAGHPEVWSRIATSWMQHDCPPFEGGRSMMGPPAVGDQPGRDGERLPRPPHFGRRFEMRLMLLDAGRRPLIGPQPPERELVEFKPVTLDATVVGYVGLLPQRHLTDAIQMRFLREQKLALALTAGVAFLVSAILAYFMAGRLVRPLRSLAHATHQLASGRFDTRVAVCTHDEVGQLAEDFNSLAVALEKNEGIKRQWVADISHDLRTPLAVLRGEIEALQDGIRATDADSLRSLHGEVMQLSRMVDDLYQLSLSDAGALDYRKKVVELDQQLLQALDSFRSRFAAKEIAIVSHIPEEDEFPVFADAERLRQLFDNLLGNSLKYTDANGSLDVLLERDRDTARIHIRDSAPGVGDADLERLFDRLYRSEASRNRATGGAGLGLAICRNIVEAHGGTISALHAPQGGLWMRIELPVTRRSSC